MKGVIGRMERLEGGQRSPEKQRDQAKKKELRKVDFE